MYSSFTTAGSSCMSESRQTSRHCHRHSTLKATKALSMLRPVLEPSSSHQRAKAPGQDGWCQDVKDDRIKSYQPPFPCSRSCCPSCFLVREVHHSLLKMNTSSPHDGLQLTEAFLSPIQYQIAKMWICESDQCICHCVLMIFHFHPNAIPSLKLFQVMLVVMLLSMLLSCRCQDSKGRCLLYALHTCKQM